jgi:hypothetical protein
MKKQTKQRDWYSVRCLFRHAKRDGMTKRHLYEERVTLWHTASFDDAVELAERDADAYADSVDAEYLGLAQAYHLFAERITSGVEAFSLMRESNSSPKRYLDTYFDNGDERQGHMPCEQPDAEVQSEGAPSD